MLTVAKTDKPKSFKWSEKHEHPSVTRYVFKILAGAFNIDHEVPSDLPDLELLMITDGNPQMVYVI